MREFGVFYPKRTLTFEDNVTVTYASVIGDDEKLVDVINGVLDNAAKFSHKETNIMARPGIVCARIALGKNDLHVSIYNNKILLAT